MRRRALLLSLVAVVLAAASASAAERAFVNLASQAKITASSENKGQKMFASSVADGRFAAKGCTWYEFQPGDRPAKSWAVNGKEAKGKATLTFEWKTPVQARQLIYYPRMAFSVDEGWKDYEIYVNGGPKPVAKGSFTKVYGGHRVRFPSTRLTKLTMKFLSSHGGMNPGATEILITDRELPDAELAAMAPLNAPRIQPWDELSKQNVVWDLPSKDEAGAMPLGNGNVLANVWVEPNGDLRLGLGKIDAKTGKVAKLGRVRVKLTPALPITKAFRQTLVLKHGAVEIFSGRETISIFIEAGRPVLHVQVTGRKPVGMTAVFEPPQGDLDLTVIDGRVLCMRGDVTAVMLADGMAAPPLTPASDLTSVAMKSAKPAASFHLQVHVVPAGGGEVWADHANGAVDANRKMKHQQVIQNHVKAWAEFWQRQSIFVGGSKDARRITKALVRKQWLSAVSGRGPHPLKPTPPAELKEYKGPSGGRANPARVGLTTAKVEAGKTTHNFARGGRFSGSWGADFANLPKKATADPLADALRDMIVEAQGGKMRLFPAWPSQLDVSFRLALSGNRRIEVVYEGGKFVEIEVWPKDQTGNVIGVGPYAKRVRQALPGKFKMPALLSFLAPCWVTSRVGRTNTAIMMKDSNFNAYAGGYGDLKWAKKHGFYLLVGGVNEWTAFEMKDEKNVIAYHMSDRRRPNAFPYFGQMRKYYEDIDPNHPTDFTMYVKFGGFGQFVNQVRPRLLEYYDYHWDGRRKLGHLQTYHLAIYRQMSINAGGIPIVRYCHPHSDPPTKMRQTVTMSLAYGVRGFRWWVGGWLLFDIHKVKEGEVPPLGDIGKEVKKINTSLKAFSPYLATARSLTVYQTKPLPIAAGEAPKDYWVRPSGDHIVMGVFRNDNGEKDDEHYYLVVGSRDIGNERTATLTFKPGVLNVARIDKQTRKWVNSSMMKTPQGSVVKVKLEPAGVELIRVVRAKKRDE